MEMRGVCHRQACIQRRLHLQIWLSGWEGGAAEMSRGGRLISRCAFGCEAWRFGVHSASLILLGRVAASWCPEWISRSGDKFHGHCHDHPHLTCSPAQLRGQTARRQKTWKLSQDFFFWGGGSAFPLASSSPILPTPSLPSLNVLAPFSFASTLDH